MVQITDFLLKRWKDSILGIYKVSRKLGPYHFAHTLLLRHEAIYMPKAANEVIPKRCSLLYVKSSSNIDNQIVKR